MPEFITEYFWSCESNRTWQIECGSYIVRYDSLHKFKEYQYDYSCTCPAYKYQKGYCKHILAVKEKRCGWDQFTSGGDPCLVVFGDNKWCCPKCCGPIFSIGHGV